MWSIHTIVCLINISLTPFCIYGGKLPMEFDNYKTCDIIISDIIETINEDLIEKEIGLIMKCTKNEQINT
jgi:hypothetical protein